PATPPPGGLHPPPPPGETPPPAVTGELAEAANRVQAAIAEVRAAQASGDFERYGRALKALDEAMAAFQTAQGARPTPAPSGSASPPASPAASGSAAPTPGG
ncbi:hypothetical protein, partial [Micromonospora sp. NPDC049799]|uniref:hypothetical protein n=1 Tax=Micromonospora sp. NPDC049799 TaxID=3154741 RepID=UPI0033F0A1AB